MWLNRRVGCFLVTTMALVGLASRVARSETPSQRETYLQVLPFLFSADEALRSGRYEEVVPLARTMLRIARARQDTLWSAQAHRVLANAFQQLGAVDSSRHHAVAALDLSRSPAGDNELTSALLVFAAAVRSSGASDSAMSHLRLAERIALERGDSLEAGLGMIGIAGLLASNGDCRRAKAVLDTSVSLLGHSSPPWAMVQARASRARCLYRLGMNQSACAEFDSAFSLLSLCRNNLLSEDGRISLMEKWRTFFDDWEGSWLRQADDPHSHAQLCALGVAERGRSQALVDWISPFDRRLIADSNTVEAHLEPARRFGPGHDIVGDTWSAILSAVPPDCCLLYYSQLPDSLVVWVYRNGVVRHLRIPVPESLPASISPLATGIIDSLMSPPEVASWWSREVRSVGADSLLALFAKCCFPDTLLGWIGDSRELIVVPDGWLNQIPFAALPVGRKRIPLGKLYPLRFSPSLELLADVEARAARRTTALSPDDVMVLGDPRPMPSAEDSLPAARHEAEVVAKMFGTSARVLEAASESLVVARWSSVRVLHLATHGSAFGDLSQALSSYVLLAPSHHEDGHLTLREIMWRLPRNRCDLVVLSACQTAFGALTESEGVIGLPRAFLANGATSVVASMWNLNDGSTSYLVRRFYGHLMNDADHPSIAVALHRAMMDTSREPGWESPRYWAAFKVYGGS